MATAAFRDWVKKGRPFTLSTPVAEYRNQLRAAGWIGDAIGTIGNEAHLTAEKPQDHTPFSATGWPGTHPYPLILAIDVMHNPGAGRDVGPLVAYWLSEARAGRTPWVKYINWQAKQYDVRNSWAERPNGGHFDHAHISFRTDWASLSVGSWSAIGKGNAVSDSTVGRQVWEQQIGSPSLGFHDKASEWLKFILSAHRGVEQLQVSVTGLATAVQSLSERPGAVVDPEALATALVASPAFVGALADAVADRVTGLLSPEDIAHTFGRALLKAEGV